MSEDKLDRFARGELAAKESRELAQKALDDPDLFDELTYTSIAKTGLAKRGGVRPVWVALAGLAAVAAVVIVALSTNLFRRAAPTPAAGSVPSASSIAMSGPPVFLGRGAESSAPVFRDVTPESRTPRRLGMVTSIEDGTATVDLGSLDGLAKGADAEVLRDGKVLGKIRLTAIFRERARGETAAGMALRVDDRVRVPAELYLRAALDQIAEASARGDSEGARRIAGEAAAADKSELAVSSYEDLNNLGGIAELRGDRAQAQALYEQALRAEAPEAARKIIENNLARLRGAR